MQPASVGAWWLMHTIHHITYATMGRLSLAFNEKARV